MTKRVKVFGGNTFVTGKQARTTVAANSQKDAIKFLEIAGVRTNLNEFRNYWCETGNAQELKDASGVVGRVIAYKGMYDKEIVFTKDTVLNAT